MRGTGGGVVGIKGLWDGGTRGDEGMGFRGGGSISGVVSMLCFGHYSMGRIT